MQAELAELSKQIYRLLGMSGYARLDFRVTADGEAYLLEAVRTNGTPISSMPLGTQASILRRGLPKAAALARQDQKPCC
jgi:D-alanine-D-alanine ligase-like ATP-grasp enzyme